VASALSKTFYWHDYETWGADPRKDRPAQFAGLRTDEELTPVGDPLVVYCRPADDLLPQPEACLVTGLSPQFAAREGVVEAQFAAVIEQELAASGTCGAGYNSIRFDDEVTRHLLYRNFFDPYAREWKNGNSRWDLIDTIRLAHALRPEGIVWPKRPDGSVSFRLEDLTAANGIEHGGAHDALADVRATIQLAKRLRERQPRLFAYALTLRDKRRAEALLATGEPLLHVSARYPAAQGCIAPVLAVARHPTNANGVICCDLREDPEPLLTLDAVEIHRRLFTPVSELSEGESRIPLKTVHTNRSPILAPISTLTKDAGERWGIDLNTMNRHARLLRTSPGLAEKIQEAQRLGVFAPASDPDLMLYSGGFFSDADRRAMDRLRGLAPEDLARESFVFQDRRLPEMLFRYRARNWPESLSDQEREQWDAYRLDRLTDPGAGASITIDAYEERLSELRGAAGDDAERLGLLDALSQWGSRVMDASG
jgi:exodeoxyribonuclease-1